MNPGSVTTYLPILTNNLVCVVFLKYFKKKKNIHVYQSYENWIDNKIPIKHFSPYIFPSVHNTTPKGDISNLEDIYKYNIVTPL